MWECNIGNTCVEYLHEGGEGDHNPDEPWVDLLRPACIFNGDRCCTTHCYFLSGIPQPLAAHAWRAGKSVADLPPPPFAQRQGVMGTRQPSPNAAADEFRCAGADSFV